MLVFLRFLGVTTAAIWFGTTFFVTFFASPAFFSADMLRLLPRSHAGAAGHVLVERFYWVQYWCGALALAHLVAECLYAGKPLRRPGLYLVLGLIVMCLVAGSFIQPKLERLHLDIYGTRSTPSQREQGRKWYSLWRGTAQFVNGLVCLGLVVYLWDVATPGSGPRLLIGTKFRG